MITSEQAIDIRNFLVKELNKNGFGDIVTEINTRLEEEYEDEKFERNSKYLLVFFLQESIEILENLSNNDFQGLVNRINRFTEAEQRIDTINIELLNAGTQEFYDLRELPNYNPIISTFRDVLQEIQKEN